MMLRAGESCKQIGDVAELEIEIDEADSSVAAAVEREREVRRHQRLAGAALRREHDDDLAVLVVVRASVVPSSLGTSRLARACGPLQAVRRRRRPDDLGDAGREGLVDDVVLVRVAHEHERRVRVDRVHVVGEGDDVDERHVRADHDEPLVGAVVDPRRGVGEVVDDAHRRPTSSVAHVRRPRSIDWVPRGQSSRSLHPDRSGVEDARVDVAAVLRRRSELVESRPSVSWPTFCWLMTRSASCCDSATVTSTVPPTVGRALRRPSARRRWSAWPARSRSPSARGTTVRVTVSWSPLGVRVVLAEQLERRRDEDDRPATRPDEAGDVGVRPRLNDDGDLALAGSRALRSAPSPAPNASRSTSCPGAMSLCATDVCETPASRLFSELCGAAEAGMFCTESDASRRPSSWFPPPRASSR